MTKKTSQGAKPGITVNWDKMEHTYRHQKVVRDYMSNLCQEWLHGRYSQGYQERELHAELPPSNPRSTYIATVHDDEKLKTVKVKIEISARAQDHATGGHGNLGFSGQSPKNSP